MKWTDWLLKTGVITADQFEDAVHVARIRSMELPDAILMWEYADRWAITQAFAVDQDCPAINFYSMQISDEIIRAVPELLARKMEVCPVAVDGQILWYATPHILDFDHRHRISTILNRDVRPMWAPSDWIWHALTDYYAEAHVTKTGNCSYWSKYSEDDWLLIPGNLYKEYLEEAQRENRI